jgi:peptidoglycan/LPS O-acetylase OafA/YrhL
MNKLSEFSLNSNYRPDIDGLRAIAVLSVVFFHAFPSGMRGGYVGVDIFFVISGYLISSIIYESLDKGTFSFAEFYARRIRRIFPALIIVLALSYAFGWFSLLADEYKQLGEHIFAGAIFLSNFLLWSEVGYFDNVAEIKPLMHLWSLGIEEQFYIVWPLLLWLAWKVRLNLFALTMLVAAVSFYLNVTTVEQDAIAAFYSPLTRFWELLSGSMLAWLVRYHNGVYQNLSIKTCGCMKKFISGGHIPERDCIFANILSILGMIVLILGFAVIKKDFTFPGKWALVPVAGSIMLILAGQHAYFNRTILSSKVAVWFGLISFPLYLWHWPMLSFARIIESDVPSRPVRICAILLAVFLAWLTYMLVERPLRFGRYGWAKTSFLLLLMAGIASAGYHLFKNEGYDLRASIRGYVNNKNELVRLPAVDRTCLDYIGIEKPLFHYCRMTNLGASETIAVIGDSHAHVAYPGLVNISRESGYNTVLLANSGCPPFAGISAGTKKIEAETCRQRIEQLLDIVTKHDDIKKIFFFTRGTVYITGTQPVTKDKVVLAENLISPDAFAEAAQSTFNFLIAHGKIVYYVMENPELAYPATACIKRPFKTTTKDCTLSQVNVMARQGVYINAFSSLRKVIIIDSLPMFCPGGTCLVFDKDGSILYSDSDHLSIAGSHFQAENLLRPYLR